MYKHIVLGTDGSTASEPAARVALRLAREQRAVLTAVYVVDPYPYLGIGATNPMGLHAYLSAARDHAALAHARVLELAAGEPAVDVRPCLVEDARAAEGILDTAQRVGADLIVAGKHGRRGADRVLPGSVAARLMRLSPVPVLFVPASGAAA